MSAKQLRNWRDQFGANATVSFTNDSTGNDAWLIQAERTDQVKFRLGARGATPDDAAAKVIEKLKAAGETVPD
jgi:hypothetical protein